MPPHPTERFDISIKTEAGPLSAEVEVPSAPVPLTSLVPLLRDLGAEAQSMEEARAAEKGRFRSCAKGCAACCRMLVPLSPPEAFRLMDYIGQLPSEQQQRLAARLEQVKSLLVSHGLWQQLIDVAESERPLNDEELAPLNEAYYSLRIPCPFLEKNTCAVYEERPSACRELLVTSPPTSCDDMVKNRVEALPTPIRIGTVLGLLWGDLTAASPRLIPLPMVAEWVERHSSDRSRTWEGSFLLRSALETVEQFLHQDSQPKRSCASSEPEPMTGL
ncbi:MAG: YkgJ family cysteine cluster protein [Nitrospira sp.]|nr:YkgJ family cysteine cluster protein [Nitrospira sp.]